MRMNLPLVPLFVFCFINVSKSQSIECKSKIMINLGQISGVPYQGIKVNLKDKHSLKNLESITDKSGNVEFEVPCSKNYILTATNYAIEKEIVSMEEDGILRYSFNYEPEMKSKYLQTVMDVEEIQKIDDIAKLLPDSINISTNKVNYAAEEDYFSLVTVALVDLNNNPLKGEVVSIKSKKRKKCITTITGSDGAANFMLLKGDKYYIDFKYDKKFDSTDIALQRGDIEKHFIYTYLGAVEIEKRKDIEAKRLAMLEEKKKKAELEFKAKCKELGITEDEGRKREFDKCIGSLADFSDTIVSAVLKRNIWKNKLIVCDLTGSMAPYSAQLMVWYELNQKNEKKLQFVFFNDGNNLPDLQKRIGATGGIYYSAPATSDSIRKLMVKVSNAGSGGDIPENNMEALIKGTKQSTPFTDLIMVVDNDSPVKDIELLKDFHCPVHIILCGASHMAINLDYLLIAWKTKGTIHTIEQDITRISKLMEGEEIVINGFTYIINGGKFIMKDVF